LRNMPYYRVGGVPTKARPLSRRDISRMLRETPSTMPESAAEFSRRHMIFREGRFIPPEIMRQRVPRRPAP